MRFNLNPFATSETTEERHQRTTVAPQQEALAEETAERVERSTRRGWRDNGTPEQQARIGYRRT